MKTKSQIVNELKIAYPVLQKGDDVIGYVELTETEYEATIELWANNELARLSLEADILAKAQAKIELLERLGITEDEAKLLLS